MKKSLLIGILTVAFSSSLIFAQTPAAASTAAPVEKSKAPATLVVEGTIASASAELIVVSTKAGKSDSLVVDTATVVKKGEKAAKIEDLTSGEKVKVHYKKHEGKLIATKIVELAAKPAAASAAPAAK